MLKWELRKIICSKFFIVSVILIIGLRVYNLLSLWDRGEEFRSSNGLFEELYLNEDEYNNRAIPYYEKIKNADVTQLMNLEGVYLENAFMDMYEIKALVNAKKYAESTYESSMIELVKKAVRAVDGDSSKYEIRYYSKYIDIYNQKVEVEPVNNVDEYLEITMSHVEITYIVMIVWVSVLTAYVIKGQEHKRLQGIYISTFNGRKHGLLAKMGALAIILFAIEMVCFVGLIINAMTMYGFSWRVLTAPIQSVPEYMYCTIHTSIIGIIFIAYVVKLLVLLMIMCIVAVFSYFTKAILAVAGSILVWALPVFLVARMDKSTYEANQLYNTIRQYYPPAVSDYSEYILNFDYARVFDFPVYRLVCVVAIGISIIAMCFVTVVLFAEKKNMEMSYGIKSRKNK